jgi:hypothetical protein
MFERLDTLITHAQHGRAHGRPYLFTMRGEGVGYIANEVS